MRVSSWGVIAVAKWWLVAGGWWRRPATFEALRAVRSRARPDGGGCEELISRRN